MKKRPMPDDFIIEVTVEPSAIEFVQGQTEPRIIKVDLSAPEFADKVLATAGRINALRRTRRAGWQKGKPRR